MADPAAATITQLKNIQARTGKTIAELHVAVATSGSAKHGERRSWLMEHFKLGYGDANAVALFIGKPVPDLGGAAAGATAPAPNGDPLDAIYTGAKTALRPKPEAVDRDVLQRGRWDGQASRNRLNPPIADIWRESRLIRRPTSDAAPRISRAAERPASRPPR